MDKLRPTIVVSHLISNRADCGCSYRLEAALFENSEEEIEQSMNFIKKNYREQNHLMEKKREQFYHNPNNLSIQTIYKIKEMQIKQWEGMFFLIEIILGKNFF